MASKKKAPESKELNLFQREILALVFLCTGLFFLLSLISYHSEDPSFFHLSTKKEILNWGGVFGAYLSDALLFIFGFSSYVLTVFLLINSVFLFVGLRKRVYYSEIPLVLFFILFSSILIQLLFDQVSYGESLIASGGFLGGILSDTSVRFLGRAGTYLIVVLGVLLSFIATTKLSFQEIFIKLSGGVNPVLDWFRQQIEVYKARLEKSYDKWRERRLARRAEIQREKEERQKEKELKIASQSTPFTVKKEEPKQEPETPIKTKEKTSGGPRILERIDTKKKTGLSPQMQLQNMSQGYQLPDINLLNSDPDSRVQIDEESLKMNARLLEKKLSDFNVEGKVTEIHPGPVITMYEYEPAAGVKLSKISNLVDDLCLAMGGRSVRIVAPLPNKAAVGIEIPNNEREMVWLKDVIADESFQKTESKITFALGKDIEGLCYSADLAKMPHLLVAGATGAGKSVAINSMILSILFKATPEEVRMILVDPKMLELSIYDKIPHLLLPVVTEPKKASQALRWGIREMEQRYKKMADINVRNIKEYNKKIEKASFTSKQAERIKETGIEVAEDQLLSHEDKLPYIVIIIDELADLMMVAGREVEEAITRLAQMARAAGIHLILATQRPSVDVITGIIKANFPSRMAFKVSSRHDSRTVLDSIGAERLLGNGDMLFVPPGVAQMRRVHGAFVSDDEVHRVVEHLKKQGQPVYDESILQPVESEGGAVEQDEDVDELYDQAIAIVTETKQASISMVQRKLRVGYNRAARMIEKMETDGIISPPSGSGQRQVLVSSMEEVANG